MHNMYRPYTEEDKLEVGTKIRLAGREGEITDIVVVRAEDIFTITWSDTRSTSRLNIYRFPNLEVMDKPPKARGAISTARTR